MVRSAALAAFVLVATVGCNTTRIVTDPDRIPVPAGISSAQVEAAIVSAVVERHITPEQLAGKSGVGLASERSQFAGRWAIEDVEEGRVTAGVSVRAHYLQVHVRYTASEVWVEVAGSRNLKQTDSRIHRKTYVWIARVEDRIRSELGRYASHGR